mgnify:CR=1 FL=1
MLKELKLQICNVAEVEGILSKAIAQGSPIKHVLSIEHHGYDAARKEILARQQEIIDAQKQDAQKYGWEIRPFQEWLREELCFKGYAPRLNAMKAFKKTAQLILTISDCRRQGSERLKGSPTLPANNIFNKLLLFQTSITKIIPMIRCWCIARQASRAVRRRRLP